MEQQIETQPKESSRLDLIESKIDYLVEESRKAARARKITLWITILVFVLPLVGIVAILPSVMSGITNAYNIAN